MLRRRSARGGRWWLICRSLGCVSESVDGGGGSVVGREIGRTRCADESCELSWCNAEVEIREDLRVARLVGEANVLEIDTDAARGIAQSRISRGCSVFGRTHTEDAVRCSCRLSHVCQKSANVYSNKGEYLLGAKLNHIPAAIAPCTTAV